LPREISQAGGLFGSSQGKITAMYSPIRSIAKGCLPMGTSLGAIILATSVAGAEEGAASPAAARQIETVIVTGKAEDGYRQSQVNLGPLGDRPLLDTPYSVYSVSADLIRNEGIETFPDLAKYIPSLQQQGHPALEFGPPVVRGMQADDTSANTRIDGMNVRGDTTLPIELYESFEVLTGPSGALYGMSYPAGTVNAILKRPGETPFEDFGIGYNSGSIFNARTDLSGHIDNGRKIGYRVNFLYSDGEGYVTNSHRDQKLAGLALDFKPFEGTVVELNANTYYFDQKGFPGGFAYSGAILLPGAPDPTTPGFGQKFGGFTAKTDIYDARIVQNLGAGWKLTVGALHQLSVRDFNNRITDTFTNNAGGFRAGYSTSVSESKVNSNLANLNGTFATGALKHDVVLGTNGFDLAAYGVKTSVSGTLGTSMLLSPAVYDAPAWVAPGAKYKSSHTQQQTLVQADTVSIGEQWSVLLGVSESWLWTKNFGTSGAVSGVYKKNAAISETAAILYKPRPDMTVYISYGSSIQSGGTAGTAAVNAGQTLAPYRSEQYEAGYKVSLTGIDLTTAIFYIERPFAAIDAADTVYKQLGNQGDLGAEFNARGKLTDEIAVFGGVTWLDARMHDLAGSNYAADDGNQVIGIAQWRANLLTEYSPAIVPGLTASVNLHYTGKRPASAENTSWAADFFTTDIGLRYVYKVMEQDVVWRAGVDNLFGAHYWLSINGNMDGQIGAGNTAYLGAPRTFRLSLSLKL
jgi:iron complex outermembrane recepter protein